jgi:hypothetical protein
MMSEIDELRARVVALETAALQHARNEGVAAAYDFIAQVAEKAWWFDSFNPRRLGEQCRRLAALARAGRPNV